MKNSNRFYLNFRAYVKDIIGRTFPTIAVDPEVMGGTPVVKGTRIPVFVILDYLACGCAEEEILEHFPSLSADDIREALAFASQLVAPRSNM